MNEAVIVSAVRTPVGKAPNGALRTTRPDEMGAVVIKELLRRVPAVDPGEIEDVVLGCAMPEAEQGLNVARIASLRAGLPVTAAAVLIMSLNRARELGLEPLARFVAYATAGVEPERFGIGPVPAIRKALKLAGLSLDQMDLVELNEAFAAQVIACLRELPIDPDRLNVNGGAIALGHPLGCTGAKLTATLLYEMRRRKARYGLVSMCVGGGMGAAGIFESM